MYTAHTKKAKRYPDAASGDEIPEEELSDYEFSRAYAERYAPGNDPVLNARLHVDGEPYAYPYWKAWTNAPALFRAFMETGKVLQKHQGDPAWKSYTVPDHELINLVLGFDSGYWGLHGAHTPNAVSSGVRIEALEALADGREHELTDEERQQVEFIRVVRDGQMTDDIWMRMVERLGSVRGAIEFAFFVVYLWAHHRMNWAMGVPTVDQSEWRERLRDYKEGRRDAADETSPYVWESMKRASEPSRG